MTSPFNFWSGRLQDHVQDPCPFCEPEEYEDDEQCPACENALKFTWASWYEDDQGHCDQCEQDDVGVSGFDHDWICLKCFVSNHKSACGCELWKKAEVLLEVSDVSEKTPCPVCSRIDHCYRHCYVNPNGEHEPDPASLTPADGAGETRGTDWIVDVCCKKCGQSGSTKIDPKEIQWE